MQERHGNDSVRQMPVEGHGHDGHHHEGHHCAHATPVTSASETETKPYYCPMCPGVESEEPGDCPKCGMSLEPNPSYRASAGKAIYTCPMHPQIERDHPGDCPICGMALELKTAGSGDRVEIPRPNPWPESFGWARYLRCRSSFFQSGRWFRA